MSWQQAWEENRTPWDAGAAAPSLVELVESGELPEGRALVPGAGSGYDVLALAGPERHAVGLDLAPGAKRRFDALRAEQGVPADQAEMVTADFFDWQPDAPFDSYAVRSYLGLYVSVCDRARDAPPLGRARRRAVGARR